MSLRESVKQLLRMCGHAAVSTVHERLDTMEAASRDDLNTQTALLQSNLHVVQALPALRSEIREVAGKVAALEAGLKTTSSQDAMRCELQDLKQQMELLETRFAGVQASLDRLTNLLAHPASD